MNWHLFHVEHRFYGCEKLYEGHGFSRAVKATAKIRL
jgi:hypothetical protein